MKRKSRKRPRVGGGARVLSFLASRRGVVLLLLLAGLAVFLIWQSASVEPPKPAPPVRARVPIDTVEVVNVFPHDRGAFTQGLVIRHGAFFESTGRYGQSTLRQVDLPTGRVIRSVEVPERYFAEGLAWLGGSLYQLTWQEHTGFVYDAATLQKRGEFTYEGEGWGLTDDGRSLILSDGTSRIRFLDPATYKVVRTIEATLEGKPLPMLNELEYVRGEIFANVWQTDRIARISPDTGQVLGLIDLTGLLPDADRDELTDVLNGITYDEATDRLFVTGKCWPKLFEVRVKAARR